MFIKKRLKPRDNLRKSLEWEECKRITREKCRTSNQECLVRQLLQLVWTLVPIHRCSSQVGRGEGLWNKSGRVIGKPPFLEMQKTVKWSKQVNDKIMFRCNDLSVRISESVLSARWLLARENVKPCLKLIRFRFRADTKDCIREQVRQVSASSVIWILD